MSVMPFAMLSLRVDPSDLDAYGYVNAMAVVKYFQAARIHYWEEAGIRAFQQEQGIGPLVVSCNMTATTPLFYPGQVQIRSRMSRIGTCSFTMNHELSNWESKIAIVAEETMVMFNYASKEKYCIPQFIRDRVQKLEGDEFPV